MEIWFDFDEKQLAKSIQSDLDKIAASYNKEFATLVRRHKGKPIAQIKPDIQRVINAYGGSLSHKELEEYAQLISDGTTITFQS